MSKPSKPKAAPAPVATTPEVDLTKKKEQNAQNQFAEALRAGRVFKAGLGSSQNALGPAIF